MAENSEVSAKNGRKPTSRTEKVNPEQALEILQAAVNMCQQCGIGIGASRFFDAGKSGVVLVLRGVELDNDRLVLANGGE